MKRIFNENETFEHLIELQKGDYESCTFLNCDFSNADLSDINFLECSFLGCNLSLTKLIQTSFKDAAFKNCKLLGLHFEDCNQMMISMSFDSCSVSLCSFIKMKLKKTPFLKCRIDECDFTETDLGNSSFADCDLQRTIFYHTGLEGVDFTTAADYSIDPDSNRIRKARFSLSGITGLLGKYDIVIEK